MRRSNHPKRQGKPRGPLFGFDQRVNSSLRSMRSAKRSIRTLCSACGSSSYAISRFKPLTAISIRPRRCVCSSSVRRDPGLPGNVSNVRASNFDVVAHRATSCCRSYAKQSQPGLSAFRPQGNRMKQYRTHRFPGFLPDKEGWRVKRWSGKRFQEYVDVKVMKAHPGCPLTTSPLTRGDRGGFGRSQPGKGLEFPHRKPLLSSP